MGGLPSSRLILSLRPALLSIGEVREHGLLRESFFLVLHTSGHVRLVVRPCSLQLILILQLGLSCPFQRRLSLINILEAEMRKIYECHLAFCALLIGSYPFYYSISRYYEIFKATWSMKPEDAPPAYTSIADTSDTDASKPTIRTGVSAVRNMGSWIPITQTCTLTLFYVNTRNKGIDSHISRCSIPPSFTRSENDE